MTSRLLAPALVLALSCCTLFVPVPALAGQPAQATQTEQEQWNEWIAARIKQSWIDMYAAEKNLDPANVKWEDLPADLRARFALAFGSVSTK
ncbi:hypothetical protein [Megalodesulfovibrio gigas]|uniref:DUF885 domain-containing protein n=1 Tax=Megalodesulfovibrio gigas (strain ATCC 19364 / DSM 1382 / NCIMB 9332 / VKM B-1759) TaxID=1121448 RepID=T2G934_MEGG1|nr:hypothetical protein [Megalodesulfovibrio gigas]AGW12626.1 hypothetical protein DGI_0724 [Megalodesulfovibrio gigas DSM 1382 = ATCC 19364]